MAPSHFGAGAAFCLTRTQSARLTLSCHGSARRRRSLASERVNAAPASPPMQARTPSASATGRHHPALMRPMGPVCSGRGRHHRSRTAAAAAHDHGHWHHDVLLVDGTNVLAFASATAGSLHARLAPPAAGLVPCFQSWVRALQAMTAAQHVCVVFDAPHHHHHDTSASPSPAPAPAPYDTAWAGGAGRQGSVDRRHLLPSYKRARALKRQRQRRGSTPGPVGVSSGSNGGGPDEALPEGADAEQLGPDSSSGGGGVTGGIDEGLVGEREAGSGPGEGAGPARRAERLRRVVEACGRKGWWAVRAPAGAEADDVLMSLAHALVEPHVLGPPPSPMPTAAHSATQGAASPAPQHSAPDVTWPPAPDPPFQRRPGGVSVVVASSDADMQQLLALSPHAGWLELLQVPGQQGLGAASEHVAALRTGALCGSMAWLPVRMHHAVRPGDALPPGKVWAGQVADFQALMGKREVGIQGVGGLSARAAANLLRKHGSVAGIAAAVTSGQLSAALTPAHHAPAAPRPHSSSTRRTAGPSVPTTAASAASPVVAPTTAPAEALPEGLRRALGNLRLTRLAQDPALLAPLLAPDSPTPPPAAWRALLLSLRPGAAAAAELGHVAGAEAAASSAPPDGAEALTEATVARSGDGVWCAALALLHPALRWRRVANAPVLRALRAGGGPAWLREAGYFPLAAAPPPPDAALGEVRHPQQLRQQRQSGEEERADAPVVTPQGLMVDAVACPSGGSDAAAEPQALGAGTASGQSGGRGLLVLGPADFVAGALEAAGAGGGGDEAAVGRALAVHVGPRQGPGHVPRRLQALLRGDTLLLLRALRRAGWQVDLLPFWEATAPL